MNKISMKKLITILMASFILKVILYITILKIDFIPIINNVITVFIFALLPILDAILIGYMINEFKRMYLKIIFAIVAILLVLSVPYLGIVGLLSLREPQGNFYFDDSKYYIFDIGISDHIYEFYEVKDKIFMKKFRNKMFLKSLEII
ncbi:MAG: hypothetical protein SPI61_03795 [Ezakiella sp.]|uniref:hypothetical protein n=1 Tax=Ezakiella sp. TaxID=1935205 RepID=UPI002A914323|nr:hypothetical protein [Ezakiella sp.]MDY6079823.1 hypothetical protein [Ezakiella sp.]